MYITNITDECNDFNYCTNNENEDNIFFKSLLLSIPCRILLISL